MARKPINAAKRLIDGLLGIDPRGDHPSIKRSSRWPKVMHAYLAAHPACEVCGATAALNCHHVLPYHLFPEHELDPANLITLCTNQDHGHDHHLLFGHCMNFAAFNPTCRADVELWRFKIQTVQHAMRLIRGGTRHGTKSRSATK